MFRLVAPVVCWFCVLVCSFGCWLCSAQAQEKKETTSVHIPPPRDTSSKEAPIQPVDPATKRKIIVTADELIAFRWNYFGLSHTFTLDTEIQNLWGTKHFLLNSYLSLGVQHFFASQNAFRFYVGFQPISILDFQFRAGIFHTYGQFNYVLRTETYDEYSVDALAQQKKDGGKVETKLGLSMRLRARLKLKFWRIILINSFAVQFFSMFGFNDETYQRPRMYYSEPISVKSLYANDFVLMNDTYLFFEVLRYPSDDRRKLWLGFYNEYVNAPNFQKDGQTGDPTIKLGLIGIYTPLQHRAMPTFVLQFKLWLLDRYLGLINTRPGVAAAPPNFEFVLAVNWDFSLFKTEQVKVAPGLRAR